jgi:hypothetical protein
MKKHSTCNLGKNQSSRAAHCDQAEVEASKSDPSVSFARP